MSKNSPKQNVQAVKEWLAFMKFKKKKPLNIFEDYNNSPVKNQYKPL